MYLQFNSDILQNTSTKRGEHIQPRGESDLRKKELQLKPWSRLGVVSLLNLSHLKFIQVSRKIDICHRLLHGLTCSFSKLKTSQP